MTETKKKPGEGNQEIKKFDERSCIALRTILLLVQDSYVSPVIDLTNPKTVWNTISNQYKNNSHARRDALLSRKIRKP